MVRGDAARRGVFRVEPRLKIRRYAGPMERSPRLALLAAALCAAGGVITWVAAFRLGPTFWLDGATMAGFLDLQRPSIEPIARRLTALGDPQPFLLLGATLVVIALVRGRPRLALAAATVLIGANVTTQLLKPVLAEGRHHQMLEYYQVTMDAWPSGHTTAAMTLALCLVLVAPARLRPVAASVGAIYAVGSVFSIMVLGWHLPSDVIGGFAVASTWTFIALAGLWAAERRFPAATAAPQHAGARARVGVSVGQALRPPLAVALIAGGLVAGVALARFDGAVAYAQEHTATFLGAGAIGGLALLLATSLAVLLRR